MDSHDHPRVSLLPSTSVRTVPDRRARPTPRFSRYTFFGGRRRRPRREDELEGTFIDRYSPRASLAVLWVALMNVGDSFFTLVHLQAGGVEVNPVAAQLLRAGRFGFVFTKSTLVAAALLVLVLHKNFPMARIGIWVSALAYTVLNVYHLTLFE